MFLSKLRHLLIFSAFLLTAVGSLPVLYGTDGPLTTNPFVEVEDAEEDQRDDGFAIVWLPTAQVDLPVSISSALPSWRDIPIVCGPHNERGPPTFYV
jgi:hypothetical protein